MAPQSSKIGKIYIVSILFFTLLCFVPQWGYANKTKRIARRADNFFSFSEYNKALPLYVKLSDADTTNATYSYRAGVCYYYSPSNKEKAIPYLLRAQKAFSGDTIPDLYYYLGHSFQAQNNFNKAISCYKILKTYLDTAYSDEKKQMEDVEWSISTCKNGLQLIKHPVKVKIENLGPNVNSKYADYAPVISANESTLIFTSRRKGSTGHRKDVDGQYFEDIYISKKIADGSWVPSAKLDSSASTEKTGFFHILFSKAKKISNSINTRKHDASVAISADGKDLFIYRSDNIWMSEFNGKKWGAPKKLGPNINSKNSYEPSVCISVDKQTLYVSSERKGGFGGKDLYVSHKQADGTWGPMANLGPVINTKYNEDAPFITEDGKTLYFSSQGHNSMGGYDIFKSTLVNGKWTKPVNLGYPINTGADDIFYVLNASGNHAYFSSIRKNTLGGYDIYLMNFEQPVIPVVYNDSSKSIAATIKTINLSEKNDSSTYTIDPNKKQEPLYLLAGDKYKIFFQSHGHSTHSIDFVMPPTHDKNPYYLEANYKKFAASAQAGAGEKTTLYAALFNINQQIKKNPLFARLQDKQLAYSRFVHSIDTNTTKLNFKVRSFIDYYPVLAVKSTNGIQQGNGNNQGLTGQVSMNGLSNSTGNGANTNAAPNTASNMNTGNVQSTNNMDYINGLNNVPIDSTYYAATGMKVYKYMSFPTNLSGIKIIPNKDSVKVRPLFFAFNKASISNKEQIEMDSIAVFMHKNQKARLEIYGYTDSIGSAEYNLKLSKKRAAVAEHYLVKKQIAASRIKTFGMGEKHPIAANTKPNGQDNPLGRQLNRRVEFNVIIPKRLKTFKPISFDFNQATYSPSSQSELNAIYTYMLNNKDIKMYVFGYTDSKGSAAYNLTLSKKRAQKVVSYFTNKGLSKYRFEAVGKGEANPIAPNVKPDGSDNPSGRALNRRVEFKPFKPAK